MEHAPDLRRGWPELGPLVLSWCLCEPLVVLPSLLSCCLCEPLVAPSSSIVLCSRLQQEPVVLLARLFSCCRLALVLSSASLRAGLYARSWCRHARRLALQRSRRASELAPLVLRRDTKTLREGEKPMREGEESSVETVDNEARREAELFVAS